MRASGIVTLTTDFGTRGGYAAQMKGVILRYNPAAVLVDVSHDIPPRDVRSAAFVLMVSCGAFPSGTVHVVVVDPGVGGPRRALCVITPEGFFLGPDNGVLSWALRGRRVLRRFSVTNPEHILPMTSPTFHGRDIFAPAAAHLSRGGEPGDLGRSSPRPVALIFPAVRGVRGGFEGEVIHRDTFGNLITNIRGDLLSGAHGWRIAAGPAVIRGVSRTYSDVPEGRALALVGSSGFLEVSVNGGSAGAVLGGDVGLPVRATRI